MVLAPRQASARVRLLLAIIGVWYAVVMAIGLPPEAHFLIYGLAGSALLVLVAYPTAVTGGAIVTGAGVLLSMHVALRETLVRSVSVEPGFVMAYAGLAAIMYLSVRAFRGPVRKDVVWGAVGIPTFVFLAEPFHTLVIMHTPRTLDPVLYRIDTNWFGDVTFATGRFLMRYAWLEVASVWCYVALALAGAAVYALAMQQRAGAIRPAALLAAWAIAGILGALCYPLVPAVGPRWVFPEWPWSAPVVSGRFAIPLAAVPRNAMPSLHAAWALLVCWGARETPLAVRCALVPWLVLTLIATLGAGGHYFIDLVAAVPLALVAAVFGDRVVGVGSDGRR